MSFDPFDPFNIFFDVCLLVFLWWWIWRGPGMDVVNGKYYPGLRTGARSSGRGLKRIPVTRAVRTRSAPSAPANPPAPRGQWFIAHKESGSDKSFEEFKADAIASGKTPLDFLRPADAPVYRTPAEYIAERDAPVQQLHSYQENLDRMERKVDKPVRVGRKR